MQIRAFFSLPMEMILERVSTKLIMVIYTQVFYHGSKRASLVTTGQPCIAEEVSLLDIKCGGAICVVNTCNNSQCKDSFKVEGLACSVHVVAKSEACKLEN